MPDLVDSYSESNANSVGYNPTGNGKGQSFTGNGGVLDSAKWAMNKFQSPTGMCYAKIYAHSGTFGTSSIPTGAALATSDAVDVSTFVADPSIALATFNFSGANRITLTNATKYVLTFEFTGGGGTGGPQVGLDTTSPTHGGNRSDTSDFSTWNPTSGNDLCFYVYTASAANTGKAFLNMM